VRVAAEARRDHGFAGEAFRDRGVVGRAGGENLDGDVAVEVGIASQDDVRGRATSEDADRAVAPWQEAAEHGAEPTRRLP
jgi:hypothetical protein